MQSSFEVEAWAWHGSRAHAFLLLYPRPPPGDVRWTYQFAASRLTLYFLGGGLFLPVPVISSLNYANQLMKGSNHQTLSPTKIPKAILAIIVLYGLAIALNWPQNGTRGDGSRAIGEKPRGMR